MEVVTTVLGRFIPAHQAQAVRDDAVLDLLFRYRINPQNQDNAPMKVPEIGKLSHEPGLSFRLADCLTVEGMYLQEAFLLQAPCRMSGNCLTPPFLLHSECGKKPKGLIN